MRDKRENEYNRTKVQDRRQQAETVKKTETFQMNFNQSPRIIETINGRIFQTHDSYLNQKMRANKNRLAAVSHCVTRRGINNSLCLEVRG